MAAIVNLRIIMVFNIEKLKDTLKWMIVTLRHFIYIYLQIIRVVIVFAIQGDIIVR